MSNQQEPLEVLRIFADATVDVPQLPYEGAHRVGDEVVRQVDEEGLDLENFAELALRPGTPEFAYVLERTLQAHGDADVPNNQGLRDGLPFAMELVQSIVFRSLALLRRGDNSITTEVVTEIDPNEVREAALLLDDWEDRLFVRDLFRAVREGLAADSDVQDAIASYKEATAAVSRKYWALMRATPRDDQEAQEALRQAKLGELNEQRGILMGVVAPNIFASLRPLAEQRRDLGVVAFAGALACGVPSEQLLQKHFRPTQEAE